MVSIKGAGVTLGGIIGLFVVNKVLNLGSKAIADITDAVKWRGYYKHGRNGQMVPPGYSRVQNVDVNNGCTFEDRHPQVMKDDEEAKKKQNAENKIKESGIMDSIKNAIDAVAEALRNGKQPKDAFQLKMYKSEDEANMDGDDYSLTEEAEENEDSEDGEDEEE